jgi:ATP-dependent DNA helicase RecG
LNSTQSSLYRKADPVTPVLQKLGLQRPFELLLHLPLRYVDETTVYPLNTLKPGTYTLAEGKIAHVAQKPKYLEVAFEDHTDKARLVFFQAHWVKQKLKVGAHIRIAGEARHGLFGLEFIHPRILAPQKPLRKTLTPIYPMVAGLTQKDIEKAITHVLDGCFEDTISLPHWISLEAALKTIHQPPPEALHLLNEKQHPAFLRVALDELIALHLALRSGLKENQKAPTFQSAGLLRQAFLQTLPFTLTPGQKKALTEIEQDLSKDIPMHRLLQGDVGSGKTVVATLASLLAVEAGFQVAWMAPTEILAEQHFEKLFAWLSPLGIKVGLLSAGMSAAHKKQTLEATMRGDLAIVCGTHALIEDGVRFTRLGLIVIDEQHRFGVDQRLRLRQKGCGVHQLMVTATPIPRTLALSYYSDLDVSVIAERPAGRQAIATKLIHAQKREELLAWIGQKLRQGEQGYWVCPLVEASEELDLQAAMDTFADFQQRFEGVGLIHGKMKSLEKGQAMRNFAEGKTRLLVATTVIEVGIDVPEATFMVIEHAERLGLSQLHQLRGRIGRGAQKSVCVLLYYPPLSEDAKTRLKVIYDHQDGFAIAEEDLRLRGPGELAGIRQSGLPELKVADFSNTTLVEEALAIAKQLPQDVAAKHLQRWYGEKLTYLTA